MEAYVREALAEGAGRLAGDRLPGHDDRLRLRARRSRRAADFRRLTQLVLTTALERAGTWVCEPLADLALEMPIVDRAGRRWRRSAGSAAASAASSRRTGCRHVERRPAGRARPVAAAPAARAVDGGGDPRDPPRRLPADRRATRRGARARARARSTATPGSRRWRSAAEVGPRRTGRVPSGACRRRTP